MIEKRRPYRNKAIREAAEGEWCTVESPICGQFGGSETTTFAHFNDQWAGKGTGRKADDCAGVFACKACHDLIDGRFRFTRDMEDMGMGEYWRRNYDLIIRQAYYKTIRRLLDKGVLK